jgi:Ala-tRNA(Pro) deacylase
MTRVTDYLERKGISFEVLEHEKAFTAAEEARSLHVDPHVVVKTMLVDTRWGRVLAVIPGDRRLDMQLLRDVVGDHHAHLATEIELTGTYPQIELGTLPPLGALLELPTFVDGDVMRHENVVFPAGSQTEAVRARTLDVFDHEHVTVTHLTREPADQYV